MRSWREVALYVLLSSGCGADSVEPIDVDLPPGTCESSFLDYENFGAPFVANWCRGCHSSDVPADMRQDAPLAVNFDDQATTMAHAAKILSLATGATPTMPPAGGPSDDERALLVEWIGCGGK
ncbi:MAG: hypothetical protein ABI867_07795 [Kofleriaceae bacterium]